MGLALDDRMIDAVEDDITVLSAPGHRDARMLHAEWKRHSEAGGFMVGIHVPSRKLGPVLPSISLLEAVDGGRDFRVRLAGTAVRRRFGRDITGLKMSDLFAGRTLAYYTSRMRRVMMEGEPFMLELRVANRGFSRMHFEWIGLRVFSPDCRHPWIMTGHFLYAD